MSDKIIITHDQDNDVLYAKRENDVVKNSSEFPEDPYVLISRNKYKMVVGAIILDAHALIPLWKDHPVRDIFPEDVLTALDLWFFTQ